MQKLGSWFDSFPKIKSKSKQQRASLRQETSSKKEQTGTNTNSCSFLKRTFRRSGRSTKKSESFRVSEWRTDGKSPINDRWRIEQYYTETERSANYARFEAISCEFQEMHASTRSPVPGHTFYTLPLAPNRPQIRTNPWYGRSPIPSGEKPIIPSALDLWKDVQVDESCREMGPFSTLPQTKKTRTNTKDNIRPTNLREPPGKTEFLDESMCSTSSSGYGSQDSSPESSVHTPDWQRLSEQYDKLVAICDNMVSSVSVRSSDKAVICSEEDFDSDLEADMSECDYCVLKSAWKTDCNGNPVPMKFFKSRNPCAPKFHAPPPPPLSSLKRSDTFLQNLNTKMDSLREKNKKAKASIRRAKEEREKKLKEKQVCLEKIQFLRDLKWVIQGNFEIAL